MKRMIIRNLSSTQIHDMNLSDLVTRIDQLIKMGEAVMSTRFKNTGEYSGTTELVDAAKMTGFRSAALSFIDRTYGAQHPHFEQFSTKAKRNYADDCETALAILEAIRDEVAGGWLIKVKGLITAEIFSDFLSMAEHLLETGYKDPAAVMSGSVLEEHLRQLCALNAIAVEDLKGDRSVPLKADRLNAELVRKDVYSKLDQKQVTAWLDLRNSAAHGKYDEYSEAQVKNMISGITEFMVRTAQ